MPNRPARLDAEVGEFKFRQAVPVRFADLDVLGHVNHIAFIEILEVGRIAYYFEVMGMRTAHEISFVLAELRIQYLASALLGQTLEVAVRVDWLKRSSSGFSFEIRDPGSGALCCAGEGVQVFTDLATNRPQSLPELYRERVLAFEGRPLPPP